MNDDEAMAWTEVGRRVRAFTADLEARGFGVVEVWRIPDRVVDLTISAPARVVVPLEVVD